MARLRSRTDLSGLIDIWILSSLGPGGGQRGIKKEEAGTLDVDEDFGVGHGEVEQGQVGTATSTMSCDDCFKTVAHSGTPLGHTETIAGVATYVSEPTGTARNKILLFFADVFGPFYLNNQLVQDWFASNGTPPCMYPTALLTATQATPSSASTTSWATGSRRS